MPIPLIPVHFCALLSVWKGYYGFWIPFLAFETLLFALALYKGYQALQSPKNWTGKKLLDVLVRDSILYYFVCAQPSFR